MTATHKTKARNRSIKVDRIGCAQKAIGDIEQGLNLFCLTHGQFSLIDALVTISRSIGQCRLSVCTWTAGSEDLQSMASMLGAGYFESVRWLVDRSFITRQPAYCRRMRELFGDGCIRTTRTHAKFITMRNDRFSLAIRTSMNLNRNARMESIEISDDVAMADFMDAEFDRYFSGDDGAFDQDLAEDKTAGVKAGTVQARRLFA